MKYFIQINQIVLGKYKLLDIKDAAILDYLRAWCQTDDKKIRQCSIKEEGVEYKYTWINFKHLIEEMPLLKIKDKGAISRRIEKLEKTGLIKTFRAPDMSLYIRLTEKIKEIEFDDKKPVYQQGVDENQQGVDENQQGVDENQQGVDENQQGVLTQINSTNNISIKHNISNNNINNNTSYKEGEKSPTLAKKKTKPYGNQDINLLLSLLKETNEGLIDGSEKENRRYCWLLLKKFGYDKDQEKARNNVIALIKIALQNEFHSKNATSFKYLYYNSAKIIKELKSKIDKIAIIKTR
jgi:DNA-binding MarR family transcriptional regulator